jgi:DDE superfamily endonuclease
MWYMIDSLRPLVEGLAGSFTQPSFTTSCQFLLGWIMCLGKHTLYRTAHSAQPQTSADHSQRHGLADYYNFFERSAWTPSGLACQIGVLLLTRLNFLGRITLLVDDTLAHKCGKSVWGMGWWRDAVASTKKRVATASGHNWVVLAVAYCPPLCPSPILALPLLARLHRPGQGQPSCPMLAKEMVAEVLGWFPEHTFTLVGDGAYACKELLRDLDERVVFVGRMRGDACVYDPQVGPAKKGRRGPKASKGPKRPKPREVAVKADRKRRGVGEWLWRQIDVVIYGRSRSLAVVGYEVVWPRVLGLRPVQVLVVRDPERRMQDCYLFTTDLKASANWVVTQFAWRWAIEVLFRSSKQVLDIEAPQHWSQESVEKVAPWVWSMQSVIMVWYVTAGHALPEALEMREVMGDWDSEWSLRHILVVLRRAILNATINPNSADEAQLTDMVQTLKNWATIAA